VETPMGVFTTFWTIVLRSKSILHECDYDTGRKRKKELPTKIFLRGAVKKS
jgi:hypothetical protein